MFGQSSFHCINLRALSKGRLIVFSFLINDLPSMVHVFQKAIMRLTAVSFGTTLADTLGVLFAT